MVYESAIVSRIQHQWLLDLKITRYQKMQILMCTSHVRIYYIQLKTKIEKKRKRE